MIAGGLVVVVLALASWGCWARRQWLVRAAQAEPVIPPLSEKHYVFQGHDEALALRTLARRATADEMRRRARAIEARTDRQLSRVS